MHTARPVRSNLASAGSSSFSAKPQCSRSTACLLILLAYASGWVAPAKAAGPGCPDPAEGVLATTNSYRAQHGTAPLEWDAELAANAQAHADKCVFAHSATSTRPGIGENVASTSGYQWPYQGMDVCSFATYAWYLEVTSYNFDAPGVSRDGFVVSHFTQLVWGQTTKLGCGFAKCSTMDLVVCQFNPSGNSRGRAASATSTTSSPFAQNVPRTACQAATRDDWCSECDGLVCTACYPRPLFGHPMGAYPITLLPSAKKCSSACPPNLPAAQNCSACTASGGCLRCAPGWKFNAAKRCLLPVVKKATKKTRRALKL